MFGYSRMTKRKRKETPKTGECAYCGKHGPLTDDHVPPKNLFATPRPSNLITVPCCRSCNQKFQKDDEYFRTVLVLWQETGTHKAAKRLTDGVLRDLKRPEKRRFTRGILQTAKPVSLFTPSGLYIGETGQFEVERLRVHRTAIRIVKGLFFHHRGFRLSDSHKAEIRISPSNNRQLELIRTTLPQLSSCKVVIADGAFCYWFQLSENDKFVSGWVLLFFNYLPFICRTVPQGFQGDWATVFYGDD